MAIVDNPVPYGLSDLKVAKLTADTPGANVDAFGAKTLSWTIESDSSEQRGDNTVIALVRTAKKSSGQIILGSTDLEATAEMVGGTIASTGTTPNVIKTLDESDAVASLYFQAIGQTNDQKTSGQGYRVTHKKLLITGGPTENLSVDAWSDLTYDFEGIAISSVILSRALYETLVSI